MMTSAQVVETSVNITSNSPSQDYTHPDDHNLPNYDWNVRINTIATKANKTLGLLWRHLKHCTSNVKDIAYRTLIRPQMEYCSSVWDPYETWDVTTLEKVQRRAARFVKGDYKRESSVMQMICDLGWQSLEARRAVSRLSLMYKIAHGLVDIESQILVRSGHATRIEGILNNPNLKACFTELVSVSNAIQTMPLRNFRGQVSRL